jgi:hypothetical protein
MWWTRATQQTTARHRVPTSQQAKTSYTVSRKIKLVDGQRTFLTLAGTDPHTAIRAELPAAMVAKTARYCPLCVRR